MAPHAAQRRLVRWFGDQAMSLILKGVYPVRRSEPVPNWDLHLLFPSFPFVDLREFIPRMGRGFLLVYFVYSWLYSHCAVASQAVAAVLGRFAGDSLREDERMTVTPSFHRLDRANRRRQPLGFRELGGEPDAPCWKAPVAHTGR